MDREVNRLVVLIVSGYMSRNAIPASELPNLISAVSSAIRGLEGRAKAEVVNDSKPTAAQIRKSITPYALISFLNGKPYKVLKRHLAQQGVTPAAYRERFGLPKDYPFTAPVYSALRADLARSGALGRPPAAELTEEA